MNKVTITKAYLLWFLISIISWIVSWKTGQLSDLMFQAVDLSGAVTPELTRTTLAACYLVLSVIYWLFTIVIFGIFVFLTNKQKIWAKYILTILCIFQIIYEIYVNYSVLTTYDISYVYYDYIIAIASVSCISLMLIKLHYKGNHAIS